jgi:hypothetical protein
MHQIEKGTLRPVYDEVVLPPPFALNLYLRNYSDIMSAQDRQEFLRQMHRMVLAKVSLDKGRKGKGMDVDVPLSALSYEDLWHEKEKKSEACDPAEELRRRFLSAAKRIGLDDDVIYDVTALIDNPQHALSEKTKDWIDGLLSDTIPKVWRDDVINFLKRSY